MGGTSEDKDRLAVESRPVPVASGDRLAAIDILRGLALFGVMAINLVFEFRVSIFERFVPATKPMPPFDRAVESFLILAVDSKSLALFSLLFGVGLAIQFDRLADNRRTVLLLRRLIALLAIGLVHLILIWNGDILTEYALAGFVALPFLFAPRWFLAAGSLFFLGVYLMLGPFVPWPDPAWIAGHISAARHVYASGGFAEVLAFRIGELPAIAPLHIAIFPRTLALFLLGAFIWRTGVLQSASEQRGLLFSLAFAGLVLTVAAAGTLLAPVTLALGYGAFVIGLVTTRSGSRLLAWAAPLGRMAFTNYLAQSLIFGWVFYGYGLGLFGQVGVAAALGFGVAVYVAQVIASRWWLKSHTFGPVEWLWRSLMYGVRQPMRLPKVAVEPR
jgi:uncharacterized protein